MGLEVIAGLGRCIFVGISYRLTVLVNSETRHREASKQASKQASPTLSSPLIPPAPQREARRSQRLTAEDIRALAETVAHLDFGSDPAYDKRSTVDDKRSTVDGTPGASEEEEKGDEEKEDDELEEAKDDAARSGSERAMSISPLGSPGALSAQASPAPAQSNCAAQEQVSASPAPPSPSSPPAPPALQRERQRERRSGFVRFSAEDVRGLAATIACLDFGTEPATDGQADGLAGDTTAEARAPMVEEAASASERASETSEQQQQPEAAMNESLGVASVHGAHDVSAGAAHAERVAASSVEGVHSDPVQHDEGRPRDEGGSSSMEHEERAEGSSDSRECREGDERESGAGSDKREAAAGSERERGGLIGGIKKKRPPRKRSKGAQSHTQRQLAARPGLAREA